MLRARGERREAVTHRFDAIRRKAATAALHQGVPTFLARGPGENPRNPLPTDFLNSTRKNSVDSKALRYAAGIGLAYAVAGVAWIVMSDAMVGAISSDPGWLATAQRYKGVFYVLATGIGLAWLVWAGYARLLRALEAVHASELLAQQALERQEAQFRQLHDSLAEVLWLASPDGRETLYVSPACERLFGITPQAFKTDPNRWFEAIHPEDRTIAAASHAALQRDGQATCEYRVMQPDGSVRWIADRKRVIVDAEGRAIMIGGIGEDITEAKMRESESTLAQARLEARVTERTAELAHANTELEAFAHTAAHDLKTPLNGIAGYLQLLAMKYGPALDSEFKRMTGQIEQSARHMATLVNDLLELSRVRATDLAPAEIDLAQMAREVIDDLRRQQPARQVEFDAPPTMFVHADAGLMRSLLANLLGNAWKFSARRELARIEMSALSEASGTWLSIADNGVGFDATQQHRLFKPFERFHALSEFQGSGIGLSTCQRIVSRHGGRIELDSEPGRGTTVRLFLPHGEAAARAQQPATTVTGAA